ncbi:MAG: L-aspartate oxidase [Vicinamibacterales bacterium]|nr:L-aspartate oxidase [Vicinamibacterales bacterium]
MQVATDFLIIGSGIAGLRAAADLAALGDVLILTKADEPAETNTGYAQGGIAVALGPDDSPALHAADTLAAGDGLCDEAAVSVLVGEGPRYVRELSEWGVRFDGEADGALAFGREAAHSVRRVLHARDATGREIARALWARVSALPRVRFRAGARAIEVIVRDGVACGARFIEHGRIGEVRARATLLATGGAGQVFLETSNPPIATGDGVTLAWYAGARVADLEFVQFHPTVLAVEGRPRFLLSEALRGEDAHLLNAAGERFMTRYEPAGELAARDLVSRAIAREARRTGAPIYLSMAHLDAAWVHDRFPNIAAACRAAGLDLARDRIPVSPAAHYAMGGVETDLWARTSVPGLFAAGEAACTGVHGANRLASNSLLEGLVFGARAAIAMATPPQAGGLTHGRVDAAALRPVAATDVPDERALRTLMWHDVGLVRERAALDAAVPVLEGWRRAARAAWRLAEADPALWRLVSLSTVGALVARGALRREESRGGHYRADFPRRDDVHWQIHIVERGHVEAEAPEQ